MRGTIVQSNSGKHFKKLIAPIVITIFLVIYFALYAMLCIYFPLPVVIRVIGACIALFFTGVCIYVFVERIIEIRSGEEDDLSKY